MAKRKQPANTRKQPLGTNVEEVPREERGRTVGPQTPVDIHAHGVEVSDPMIDYVHQKLGAKLGAFSLLIERVSVRFDDLNGPRGGLDCECRLQVMIAGRPTLVATERAKDPRTAFDGACQSAARAVKRSLERAGYSQGLRASRRRAQAVNAEPAPKAESRSSAESKERKSRNAKARTPKSAAALELTTDGARPSRLSTRKSANRVRSGLNLALRTQNERSDPTSRAESAKARRRVQ